MKLTHNTKHFNGSQCTARENNEINAQRQHNTTSQKGEKKRSINEKLRHIQVKSLDTHIGSKRRERETF